MNDRALDNQAAEYRGLVESLAARIASRWQRHELDDIKQEGMIAVWLILAEGGTPTEDQIEKRMRKWMRLRRKQLRDVPTEYESLLPMGNDPHAKE